MATLTVGPGQAYSSIAAAVAASASGDTVDVLAGTYTNDFPTVSHSLTIQGIGGAVTLVATQSPPNGKAILDEGGAGVSVTISGLSFSGARVADNNGAGIRYEGGTLVLDHDSFTGNQDGLLGAADPNGAITISNSLFSGNGAGDGYSHNIYVGAIARLVVQTSTIKDAVVGHDIKSRAASNTITGNTITDTQGDASYEIDLPNGGAAVISGNVIEKGPQAQNPIAISYGEEGNLPAAGSLSVTGNVVVNDDAGRSTTAVKNATGTAATVSGNTFYGWTTLAAGPAATPGNTVASTEPALVVPGGGGTSTGSSTSTGSGTSTGGGASKGSGATTLGSGPDSIVLKVSEDAWQGDAQFTVSVDGQQVGGTQTATASHAAGQSQTLALQGAFGTAQHTVAVTFLNDAYAGTAATDRNLYVDAITDGALTTPGAALLSNGTASFLVGTPPVVTVGAGASKAVLFVSEDAWQGDAQFTVRVDGQQVGGTQTAAALHGAGQTQEFDILGAFTPGAHQVAVTFLNDAYAGTAATDRNLYVDKVGTVAVNSPLYSSGTQSFAATVVPAS